MSLVSSLVALPAATTGEMEYTVVTIGSLVGVQEVEPGWVLANGVTLPVGAKYNALRDMMTTNHGPYGTLPTLIDGVVPVGLGTVDFPVIGVAWGAINVTLGVEQITEHAHNYNTESTSVPLTDGWANNGSTPPFDDPGYNAPDQFFAAGGGGSHNNMPPFVVVEGILIKL